MNWAKINARKRMAEHGVHHRKEEKRHKGFVPAMYGLNKWREHGRTHGKLADYLAERERFGLAA